MASVKVLCSIGLQGAFVALAPRLEKRTGATLVVAYGVASAFKNAIENGETFDVAILTQSIVEDLVIQGSVVRSSVVDIARSGLGLAVPLGAIEPDISSVKALKHTLLAAGSIASSANGLAGSYFLEVIEAMDITQQITPKIKLETQGGYAAEIVAQGNAELAVQLISEILPVAGVRLVGSFPVSVQKYAILSAGIGAHSNQTIAAQAIIDLLADPLADDILRARGLDRCE